MFKAKETRRDAPVRLLIHGDGGVGKSTFAAGAPSPIFIAAEDGLVNIDARAVDPSPSTWDEVLLSIDWIATQNFRTVVVDSLDWLEPLCWAKVCSRGGKRIMGKEGPTTIEHIEAFGWGKGYTAALDEWRTFIRKLQSLGEKQDMNVVFIAHSVRKAVRNPDKDDYDAWQIKLQEKAVGLFKEWVHVIGFAQHEVVTEETSGRAKGITTGKRILRCNPAAAYDSKTRYAMPRALPLDWNEFDKARRAASMDPKAKLRAELDVALVALADEETTTKCNAFLAERGETVASLSEALETINGYLAERRKAG